MTAKDLLYILDDLGNNEFERLSWCLKYEEVGNIPPIKESWLSNAKERWHVVELMVQNYTFVGAVEVIKKFLKENGRNDLIMKLKNINLRKADQERVRRKKKRVHLSAALRTFMTSSGVISKYQTRFQQSLRSPVALEVGSDLLLSSLSSAALDEAETAVLRDLSEVTVQLQGSTATSPHLDKVKEILIKAKDEANLQELRVDISFVPRAAATEVQLVGYTENVNNLKEVLLKYQIEHFKILHQQCDKELQKNISDKGTQAGGAGEHLLNHRTTQDNHCFIMKTEFSHFAVQNGRDLRIVMIGKTGVGKSAVGNTILGEKRFKSSAFVESATKTCEKHVTRWGNRVVSVIDTPGNLNTHLSPEFIREEIVRCVTVSCPGPHVFLLVIAVGRFSNEEKNAVEALQELFGPKVNRYMIVLFTRGSDLGDMTIEEYVRDGSPDLQRLIQSCGGRFHVFDNKTRDRNQVVELIKKIDDMVAGNYGTCYTDAMYQEHLAIAKRQNTRKKDLSDHMMTSSDSLLARILIYLRYLQDN